MAVLNDKKLEEYLSEKKIKITPAPRELQIQPASIDLRLDNKYMTFNTTQCDVIDTRRNQHYGSYHTFSENVPLVLHPHQFVLCQTLERVCVPSDLLARVEGRSSVGRLGVTIHVTAGFIDPGFEGNITLEVVNLGNLPVVLYPFQRVCQIVFEELTDIASKPYGFGGRNKYQGQSRPTQSTIFDDK